MKSKNNIKTFEEAGSVATLDAKMLPISSNTAKPAKQKIQQKVIWYDTQSLKDHSSADSIFSRISNIIYNGVILYLDTLDNFLSRIPKRFYKVIHLENENDLALFLSKVAAIKEFTADGKLIIASKDLRVLKEAKKNNFSTCLRIFVENANDLHFAIDHGISFEYLMLGFADPTNIPLELAIASLQYTDTLLIKEVRKSDDVDDAIVVSGVMEVGVEGVVFSPLTHKVLDGFVKRLNDVSSGKLNIEVGVITDSRPIGMGYRACIDLSTLFSPHEGMLVGSTSQGGILCCPEVFHLPYMELRPFRVNAGGIHSYVYNVNNKTDYMSELKSGNSAMIVGTDGGLKQAPIGRVKIEVRPLRLIEARFNGDKTVSIIMQDDWHVRVFSHEGKPINITELKQGDKVLGYVADPGRHVGIKITENILEK